MRKGLAGYCAFSPHGLSHFSFLISHLKIITLRSLEDIQKVVPNNLDRRDVEAFFWRMYAAEGGTNADHVELGVFFAEETAFKTGMDGKNLGFLVVKGTVTFSRDAEDFALGVHLPTRVAFARFALCTTELEARTNDG